MVSKNLKGGSLCMNFRLTSLLKSLLIVLTCYFLLVQSTISKKVTSLSSSILEKGCAQVLQEQLPKSDDNKGSIAASLIKSKSLYLFFTFGALLECAIDANERSFEKISEAGLTFCFLNPTGL